MDKTEVPNTTTPDNVEAAIDCIAELVSTDSVKVVQDFARLYTRRIGEAPMLQLSDRQLAAHIVGVFNFASGRGLNPIAVRVFNPSVENHGYSTAGTVVEVSTIDRPFLVDSVIGAIQSQHVGVDHVVHPVIGTTRNDDGYLTSVNPARNAATRESVQHHQLDRMLGSRERERLHDQVVRTLGDVRRAVDDFEALQSCIPRMIELAHRASNRYTIDEVKAAESFLNWLTDMEFIFLGYREYEIKDVDGVPSLSVAEGSGLGILRGERNSAYQEPVPLSDLRPELRARYESGDLLVITKANSFSTVHRRVKLDYIGIRTVDPDGNIDGEARLLGLFTSKAYMAPASKVPLLEHKLQQIVEAEDLIEGTHDHKATVEIFETFPKEELFSAPVEELRRSVIGLVQLRESQNVRLFVRRDLFNRSVAIVVALPRDRFNAALRKRLQQLFIERFNGTSVDYHLALGETDPAQIYFTVWVTEGEIPEVSFGDLEKDVVVMTRTWQDRVADELAHRVDGEEALRMAKTWAPRFPDYYQTSVQLGIAAGDIMALDRQYRSDDSLVIGLQNEAPDSGRDTLTRLTVYRRGDKMPLSGDHAAPGGIGVTYRRRGADPSS